MRYYLFLFVINIALLWAGSNSLSVYFLMFCTILAGMNFYREWFRNIKRNTDYIALTLFISTFLYTLDIFIASLSALVMLIFYNFRKRG